MNRFAYICADSGVPIPGYKGSSNHVRNVCRALRAAGLDGTVFARRPGADELEGCPVIALGNGKLRGADGYDFVYERYSLWHVEGLACARRMNVPFVLEVNSPLPDEARTYRSLDHPERAEEVAKLLLRHADGIVCVSGEVADWVVRYRIHARNVWTIPNGVDENEFSPERGAIRAPFECATGPVIGFAGSFRPWHGVDALVDALAGPLERAALRPRLLCVGDGPGRAAFEARAKQSGLAPRVHTTGFVPQPEVAAWLNGCDLAVAPYEPRAGFYFSPLKVFEFMALGLPVVAADIGQLSEILGDDRGWLYRPGDTNSLANAISDVLGDAVAARDRAERARRWVLAAATWKHRVAAILERVEAMRASYA
ncbi:MAG: glycosyltransferase family 4 protein [Acidobacteriota bacterium]